jgi:hypothetical protein
MLTISNHVRLVIERRGFEKAETATSTSNSAVTEAERIAAEKIRNADKVERDTRNKKQK